MKASGDIQLDLAVFWYSASSDVLQPAECALKSIYACLNSADAERSFSIYNVVFSETHRKCCGHRLKRFNLTALGPSEDPLYEYIDRTRTPKDMYIVTPSTPIRDVKVVNIKKRPKGKFLTLCEVEVFGEILCPANQYGLGCQRKCNCADKGERCFVHSGGCPSGCASGWVGEDCTDCEPGKYSTECTEICNETCGGENNPCDKIDGACSQGCDPGYTGIFCQLECEPSKYGAECGLNCSVHCAGQGDTCDHVTGNCTKGCEPGYTGKKCDQECEPGKYGAECGLNCSVHCAGQGEIQQNTKWTEENIPQLRSIDTWNK
ncbi:hypothetical protein RRG08_059855 [Elysia crispata]|uniref:Laminin EGF-like domain-containing protein n=1 Tax=Elysia crispata TaxID=231223 RepID=A0AAE1AFT5_9GAST|nr:hypothetical protein RRG08_059855 [Elysia crispata]